MRLLIDILQGAGLAGAAGIRPFLPALVAGALATADVGIDYEGTPFAFLEQPGWLLAVVLALIAAVVAAAPRRRRRRRSTRRCRGSASGSARCCSPATLADHGDAWWPGLARRRGRAPRWRAPRRARSSPACVPGSTTRRAARCRSTSRARPSLLAALAVVAAPISVLALGFFAFLLRGGKRREGEKYAGLRILR